MKALVAYPIATPLSPCKQCPCSVRVEPSFTHFKGWWTALLSGQVWILNPPWTTTAFTVWIPLWGADPETRKDWMPILAMATCWRDPGEVCLAPKKETLEEIDFSVSSLLHLDVELKSYGRLAKCLRQKMPKPELWHPEPSLPRDACYMKEFISSLLKTMTIRHFYYQQPAKTLS